MKKILILGVGAIGSWLTENLAADLPLNEYEVTVMDWDIIEERNVRVNTQNYLQSQVGSSKVEALQYNVYKALQREILIVNEKLTRDNAWMLDEYDLVIDCFDNADSRNIVQLTWELMANGNDAGNYWGLLHVGFSDKLTFELSWSDHYPKQEDINNETDVCELAGVGSFIKLVAALTSLTVQEYLQHLTKKEFIGNSYSIREIK